MARTLGPQDGDLWGEESIGTAASCHCDRVDQLTKLFIVLGNW